MRVHLPSSVSDTLPAVALLRLPCRCRRRSKAPRRLRFAVGAAADVIATAQPSDLSLARDRLKLRRHIRREQMCEIRAARVARIPIGPSRVVSRGEGACGAVVDEQRLRRPIDREVADGNRTQPQVTLGWVRERCLHQEHKSSTASAKRWEKYYGTSSKRRVPVAVMPIGLRCSWSMRRRGERGPLSEAGAATGHPPPVCSAASRLSPAPFEHAASRLSTSSSASARPITPCAML